MGLFLLQLSSSLFAEPPQGHQEQVMCQAPYVAMATPDAMCALKFYARTQGNIRIFAHSREELDNVTLILTCYATTRNAYDWSLPGVPPEVVHYTQQCGLFDQPYCDNPDFPTPVTNEYGIVTDCINECAERQSYNGWVTYGTYFGGAAPPAPADMGYSCKDGCTYFADGPSTCQATDVQPNGQFDDNSDLYSCLFAFNPDGQSCTEANVNNPTPDSDPNPPPNGNQYDCTVVDCGTPPANNNPGGGDDNDSGGSDDATDGGAPPGDGNPDTPDNPGDGTGDTDGDEERDVDCNPLHNSDCTFRGSASASHYCGTKPTCSGQPPAECAQLHQQYNIMCAVLKSGADMTATNNILSDIRTELKGGQAAGADSVSTEGIEALKQAAEDKEAQIFDGSGDWFRPKVEDSDFTDQLVSEVQGHFALSLDSIFSPTSCPVLTIHGAGNRTYQIDIEQRVKPLIQFALRFVIWYYAIMTSYFLFFRWGFR